MRRAIVGPWRAILVLGCCALALPASAQAQPHAAQARVGAATASHAASGAPQQLSVNWALSGTATAASSQSGNPASNAIDGDAATSWCATWSPWPDTLTVDLGQVRQLDGFGITLDNASSSARVSISLATTAGQWQPVASAQNVALDAGNPMYIPLGTPQLDVRTGSLGGTLSARYAQVTAYSAGASPVCIGEFRMLGPDPAANMMLGSDVSFTANELAAGAVYTDYGVRRNPINILADHGANWARLRLWVNPPAGYSDLNTDLSLARMIKAAGQKLYLDLHYSDFWADPGKQCIPAGWPNTLSGLTSTVRTYTQQVLSAFAAQGTPVDMVSIGNEVTNGMLWTYDSAAPGDWVDFGCSGPGIGGLSWSGDNSATGWASFTQLLNAGVIGARAGNPHGHTLLIAIHTDLGGGETPYGHNDTERAQYFYSQLQTYGVPFDVIVLSYYPVFQGSLAGMRTTVNALATQFQKPIVLGETQYPWTLADGNDLGNTVWQASQLIDAYPDSPGGQISMVNDELSILAAAPHGLGMGDFYWEPEWIPGVSWAPYPTPPGPGGPTTNQTLFDFSGRALPSVGIFQDPVKICARYNPYNVPCVIGG
jgi:arabinogalactan endo-1,4-beta-galactosidase